MLVETCLEDGCLTPVALAHPRRRKSCANCRRKPWTSSSTMSPQSNAALSNVSCIIEGIFHSSTPPRCPKRSVPAGSTSTPTRFCGGAEQRPTRTACRPPNGSETAPRSWCLATRSTGFGRNSRRSSPSPSSRRTATGAESSVAPSSSPLYETI